MKRQIHVWSESYDKFYPDPGYADGHTLGTHHGSAAAETLQEAADKVFADSEHDRYYDRERMTYWGCALFEREPEYV